MDTNIGTKYQIIVDTFQSGTKWWTKEEIDSQTTFIMLRAAHIIIIWDTGYIKCHLFPKHISKHCEHSGAVNKSVVYLNVKAKVQHVQKRKNNNSKPTQTKPWTSSVCSVLNQTEGNWYTFMFYHIFTQREQLNSRPNEKHVKSKLFKTLTLSCVKIFNILLKIAVSWNENMFW